MITSADSIRVVQPLFQEDGDGSHPISALQLIVRQIELRRAQTLNAVWHSRLPLTNFENLIRVKHRVCFGAEYLNRWYAVAIWTSPVARQFNNRGWLELRRFAIASDAPRNTGSRMLRVMAMIINRDLPDVVQLISYQDTKAHTGAIYKAAGWLPVSQPLGWGKGWGKGWQSRKRNAEQTLADKVRWEKQLLNLASPLPRPSSARSTSTRSNEGLSS